MPGQTIGEQQPLTTGEQEDNFLKQQPFTSGEQLLTTGEQVFTTGQQVLTTGEQGLTTGEQVLTTGEQVLTTGEQVFTTGEKVLTTGEQDVEVCEERWVRALTSGEQKKEMSQAVHQHQITCYRLGLCSQHPVREEAVERALTALWRKVRHLRFCIQERNEKLWFREMDCEDLQFKVLENVDVMEEVEHQGTTSLPSSTGPLWRAVLIPAPATDPPFMEDNSTQFPHQYNLLLTFHHAITDGYTTVRVCDLFLSLLNDVIAGNPIDEMAQVGRFGDGLETLKLITEHKAKLDKKPKIKQMAMRHVQKCSELRPLITEAFPVPEVEKKNTTLHIARQLTREQTSKLIVFFKEEGITLNSGFMAMANLAFVDMFKKRGFQQKMFEISSFNAVNLRRYWSSEFKEDFGCHYGPLCLITETPRDSSTMFLEYTHDIQTNINDYLENGRTFDECLFLDVKLGTGHRDMDAFFTNPPEHPHFFYSNTNMGDLSGVFSGEGEHVQVGWLSRHNSIHRYNSTFVNNLQTFRGRLMIGIDYNARHVTTHVATEYVDTVLKMILDIVRQMS